MLLHIDENVPDSVADVFRTRGHNVFYVRDLYPRGTPDPVIARAAMALGAVVVTWDNDFKRLADKPQFLKLSVITFNCAAVDGVRRATEAMALIEFQYEQAVSVGGRLSAEVMIRFVRLGQ